jgi:alanine transaminase
LVSSCKKVSGTSHIRCTILPGEETITAMVPRLQAFHEAFMDEFRG